MGNKAWQFSMSLLDIQEAVAFQTGFVFDLPGRFDNRIWLAFFKREYLKCIVDDSFCTVALLLPY